LGIASLRGVDHFDSLCTRFAQPGAIDGKSSMSICVWRAKVDYRFVMYVPRYADTELVMVIRADAGDVAAQQATAETGF
jgi:hypothetical protein